MGWVHVLGFRALVCELGAIQKSRRFGTWVLKGTSQGARVGERGISFSCSFFG